MKKEILAFLCAVVSCCLGTVNCSTVAQANDSSASDPNLGLELTKTNDVEMLSEDLYISVKKIKVIYKFKNLVDRDVELTVAFPMPTVDGDDPSACGDYAGPPHDFSTQVNGQQIPDSSIKRTAVFQGKDITAKLEKLGVNLNPRKLELESLSPEARNYLKSQKLIKEMSCDEIKAGAWKFKEAYFWKQRFPAGAIVTISHQYTPSVGSSVPIPYGDKSDTSFDRERKRYCLTDPSFAKALQSMHAGNTGTPTPYFIDYILTSGANWANGAIGDFRLVVDKGHPENWVSFCGDNVKKITPTQFEMKVQNYTPKQDLSILFFGRHYQDKE